MRHVSDKALRWARELEDHGYTRRETVRLTGISRPTLIRYLGKYVRKTTSDEQTGRSSVKNHLRDTAKIIAPYHQQLCWACARSAAGKDKQCSWDAKLQPVEGWTVDKDGFVVSCPEFEEDKR